MKKLKFDSFTGGCHTPLIHTAIDRTLTSFPNETSSVLHWSYLKKLPSLDGWLVSCHISIQGIVKTLHSGQWMFWHFIRLFDWRIHVLIQIVSETDPGMAVLLHVTPCHVSFGEIGLEVISTGVLSLPLIYVGKLSYTGETMWTRSEGLSMSRNSDDRLSDLTVVWLGHKFSVKQ